MTLFVDLTKAEIAQETDELLVKQGLVYRRVELDDVIVGKSKEVTSGVKVSGTGVTLTQTGVELQEALDQVQDNNNVSVQDNPVNLTQTANELQSLLNKSVGASDTGGNLTQTFSQIQSLLDKSIGVSGTGGDLTNTLVEVQETLDKSVGVSGSGGNLTQTLTQVQSILDEVGDKTSIGVNQSRLDLTASRTIGTTYTNSASRPIFLTISAEFSAQQSLILSIEGNDREFGSMGAGTASYNTVSAIVMAGESYVITGTGTITLVEEIQ